MQTELCKLFELYGADKCPQLRHSYSMSYHKLLAEHRNTFRNVLEIGIGTENLMKRYMRAGFQYQPGASLRAWRDYFSIANIYGIDIEKSVLFNEDRINCFYTDQSDKTQLHQTISDIRTFAKDESLLFDFILDDGSHIESHMILSMQTLDKYVVSGGYYIIEDVKTKFIDNLKRAIPNTMTLVDIYYGKDNWDNYIILQKV
jgi:hypothetical protein